ncbi:MAG: hypothetical protein RL322_2187 [Pseudomonadota bacterium]
MSFDGVHCVQRWLACFDQAAEAPRSDRIQDLFLPDAHWREALGLSWAIRTVSGGADVARALFEALTQRRARQFAIDPERLAPRIVERAGVRCVEAIIRFETAVGAGAGLLRLREDQPERAWTFHTALEAIRGHEEDHLRRNREEPVFDRDFHGPNWLDRRSARARFDDREPTVLVVGAGHAGLAVAARLGQLEVDTLVVDREVRAGDNWRLRYHALRLHNTYHSNHLPYIEFPSTWQQYLPKDRIAHWLEAYVDFMDIQLWTQTGFEGASWCEAAQRWAARLQRPDGSIRTVRPQHIIMATGISGTPKRPSVPTLERFAGSVLHTSEFADGAAWRGRAVLVLGSGTSAHDVAQDLHGHGARVTMIQRSPTLVIQVEPSAQLYDSVYLERSISIDDRDLIATSIPKALMLDAHRQLTRKAEALDASLLQGLEQVGFRLSSGIDGTGWPLLFRERGGGYYFNVGCSDLIASRAIGLMQYQEIETFTPEGLRMKDGRTLPADLVVLATGYEGHDHAVRQYFGPAIAERVGKIWGFDANRQELANMWARTPQPGLWFTGGPFSLCRAYSKFLALQIKAATLGINH